MRVRLSLDEKPGMGGLECSDRKSRTEKQQRMRNEV